MKLRIFSAILALLLLLTVLASCAKKGGEETEDTQETVDTTEDTTPRTWEDLEAVDMGGEVITILTRDSASTTLWKPLEWYSDGFSNEIIPDAVYRRNVLVQEKYNCTIQQIMDDEYLAAAQADFLSQGSDYDIVVMPIIQQISAMAVNGYLYDLDTISTLKLDDPWWDTKTNDSISLMNHHYTLCGDLDIIDNMATWCILFNKDMASSYQLDNHYDVVNENKWTLEKMYQNAARVSSDDETGVFGIACQIESAVAFLAAADMWCFTKDDTDTPVNQMRLSATFSNTIDEIYAKMRDRSIDASVPALNLIGDNSTDRGVGWGTLYNTFASNKALYCMGTISNVMSAQIGNMKYAYGILPVPMHNEDVGEYISTFQPGNATGVSILAHHADAEKIGVFLTALSAASSDTLVPAFYETTLEAREVPDAESLVTLKIIIGNREVDIGYVISSGTRTVLNTVFARSDVSSGYQGTMNSYIDVIATDLENMIKAINSNFEVKPST